MSITPIASVQLDSTQLRLIAEAASGYRGVAVRFVALPDGTIREERDRKEGPAGEEPPESTVIPAFTADRVPDKPRLTHAAIQAEGVPEEIDLLNLPDGVGRADAVFWSESSVEKFLLPYYASVYGNQAARAVGDILEAFHGDRGDRGEGKDPATPPDAQTYAIAHIPKSDYVIIGGQEEVGFDLAVIYRDHAEGALKAMRLPDFLRLRRAPRE